MRVLAVRVLRVMSWIIILLSAVFLSGCDNQDTLGSSELSSSDSKAIAEYARTVKIAEAVGQLLMVGLPADINTVRDKAVSRLPSVSAKVRTSTGVQGVKSLQPWNS